MSWNEAIGEVSNRLPKFNDYVLKDYRKEQVARFPEFINVVFQEAVKLFNGDLKYLGYRTLSPERRIAYSVENGLIKGRVNIQQSELELLEFQFEYDEQLIQVYLYLPYLYQGALVINDTRYYMHLAIIERMIYRVTDGVIIKVMRSPLQFWRTEQYLYSSESGKEYADAIITVKAHYRKERPSSKPIKTPLILYLLAQYEFDHVVSNVLGLPRGSVTFVKEPKKNDEHFEYFKCRDEIYLKVNIETVMNDTSFRRFVASLLYILNMIKRFSISDCYDRTFYKMILGKNLYGMSTKEALAAGHAEGHLDSLKTYLDQFTKRELALMRIYCEDIFDLFTAVFFNIDSWLVSYSPNDLFEKRIGGAELVLMDMVKSIFTRFYDTIKKNKVVTIKNIRSMLKMDPMRITGVWKVASLTPISSLYNDNILIPILIKKIRQSSTQENAKKSNNLISSKEHQMHPSFTAIESPLSISVSNPGVSGDINPFVQINNMGYFQKQLMPWYNEILPMQKYLVQV